MTGVVHIHCLNSILEDHRGINSENAFTCQSSIHVPESRVIEGDPVTYLFVGQKIQVLFMTIRLRGRDILVGLEHM